MRRVIAFSCEAETLIGSLDEAAGTTGLLIVSGGNEPRMGAHRGMALLAARVAATGSPVFRFDRRGVGDAAGENGGWESSAPDLAAAAAEFRRAVPGLTRIVGFGNCDAATALALFGAAAGIDALVLANPWVVEHRGDLPPTAAIRARYAERLFSLRAWGRLVRGRIDLRKAIRGLWAITQRRAEVPLARRFAASLAGRAATIVLAKGDATAIAFRDAIDGLGTAAEMITIDSDSHSFARSGDAEALEHVVIGALAVEPSRA